MSRQFEWDQKKADRNFKKHGVTFDQATTVFADPFARIFGDPGHSMEERREIIIGHSKSDLLLMVGFTERPGRLIRIFTARPAIRREREDYEENTEFQLECDLERRLVARISLQLHHGAPKSLCGAGERRTYARAVGSRRF